MDYGKSIEWAQVAPGDWMSTLKQIRKHYPEIWDLIFLKYYENGGHTRRRRKLKGLLNTDRSVDVACGSLGRRCVYRCTLPESIATHRPGDRRPLATINKKTKKNNYIYPAPCVKYAGAPLAVFSY